MAYFPLPGELIELICTDSSLVKRDLSCLARVSKDWRDVATPILWKSLPGLLPLLTLMPQDALRWIELPGPRPQNRALTLLRLLTEEDWVPVYPRSCFVETLHFRDSSQCPIYIMLYRPSHCDLLPNLRRLHFTVDSARKYPETYVAKLLDMLISPRLLSLEVLDDWSLLMPDPVSLSTRCGLLEDLSLQSVYCPFDPSPLAYMQDLIEAIGRWPNLRTVNLQVEWWCHNLLSTLANKDMLSTLDLHFGDFAVKDQRALPPVSPGFPSLLHLGLCGMTGTEAAAALQCFEFRKLECLHLTCMRDPSFEEVVIILQAVHDRVSHTTLREFRIDASRCQPRPLHYQDLQPLAVFSKMTNIHLNGTAGLQLTDDEHEQVALWWPNVEVLEYNTASTGNMAPLATLKCLAHYARCCLKLRQLHIPITTLDDNIPWSIFNVASSNLCDHPLSVLCVGESYLASEHVARVARYLADVFPSLVRVECSTGSWSAPDGTAVIHEVAKLKVNRTILALEH